MHRLPKGAIGRANLRAALALRRLVHHVVRRGPGEPRKRAEPATGGDGTAALRLPSATVESGAGSAADWVAIETRQVRREARADLRLAENLETHRVLASAMAAGRVNLAQGRAIIASLERLPRTGRFAVSAEQRAAAETHLVELAADHDAKALRVLGRRVFEVIAPDLAEEFEGRALEREEAEALRRTTLTMWEDDEGTCHGRFRLPALHGQMLTKMILAISAPARAAGAGVLQARVRSAGSTPTCPPRSATASRSPSSSSRSRPRTCPGPVGAAPRSWCR